MAESLHVPMRTKSVRITRPDKAIPLKEFAASYYVVPRTVLRWIRSGKVAAYKTGGRWYVYVGSYTDID